MINLKFYLLFSYLFLFVFSLTLIEYGGYKLAFISSIGSLFFIRLKGFKIQDIYGVYIYILFSMILYFVVVFNGDDVQWGGDEYYPKFRSYIVYLGAAVILYLIRNERGFFDAFKGALRLYLILTSALFLAEILFYYLTGYGFGLSNYFLGVKLSVIIAIQYLGFPKLLHHYLVIWLIPSETPKKLKLLALDLH